MRCMCCNAILPPNRIFRTILIRHPKDHSKTTTMRVEEDFCVKCAGKSDFKDKEVENISLQELGLDIPNRLDNDY